jgi:hypothetical protein
VSLGAWLALAAGIGAVLVVLALVLLEKFVSDDWTDGPGE